MANQKRIKDTMNRWASEGIPFLFMLDFEMINPQIFRLNDISPGMLLYYINGNTNCKEFQSPVKKLQFFKHPESFSTYLLKYNLIKEEIDFGNTYLVNLTCSTPVEMNLTIREVFLRSRSRYRIWYDDQFVCFSPETFITVKDGSIRSYPMKGTIDAGIPDAERITLNDFKETAEHNTIVDLIRNDLSKVSHNVRVERFRYTDIIKTNDKNLLQVSSEICGDLEIDYISRIGDILFELLPAGSVSGAPKKKTAEIIAEAEGSVRGYYTGVFGIFDGHDLDSAVMIRFIEKRDGKYFYRSGGGITSFSDPVAEYNEMIDKIYVPSV